MVRTPDSSANWFSPPLPRIIAHRGFAFNGAPENTLEAFEQAARLGVLYIETDVHASRDGVAMIAHDSELSRVADSGGLVSDLTVPQLQALDLGSGNRMPTLREALLAFPTLRFNIDVKSADAAGPTASAVLDAGAQDRVLITSFSARRRHAAISRLPGVATSASAPQFALILVLAKVGLLRLVPFLYRKIQAVQVPPKVGRIAVASPRVIRAVHRAGLEMHVWTVNDPPTIERLLDLGVDGIVTDQSDRAVPLAGSRFPS